MLRLTVGIEDYIQINDNIRIVFLGGSQKNMRVMIDAPKEVNIARGNYYIYNQYSTDFHYFITNLQTDLQINHKEVVLW